MSSPTKDILVDGIKDWLIAQGHKPGDGICMDEKGVFIFKGGQPTYMPEILSDAYKLMK